MCVCDKLPQRYRFVFLDGCRSYSYQTFADFGAEGWELPTQDFLSAENNNLGYGGDPLMDYAAAGLWPAAWMGNLIESKAFYVPANGPDYWTCALGLSFPTPVRSIEALGNWHMQFLSLWIGAQGVPPRGLLAAKQQADNLAWLGAIGNDPNDNVAPPPPPANQLCVGKDTDGTLMYYSPVTTIKIGGYSNLGFNQYNHAGDWPTGL